MKLSFRKVLVGILALAGFSGCAPKVEYGCPQAKLKLKATVVDQAGNPVGNTSLVFKDLKDNRWIRDEVTGEDGTLSVTRHVMIHEMELIEGANVVYYEEGNPGHEGKYKDDSVAVKAEKVGKGDGRWDYGTYEMKVDLKLKERQNS
ncbi:MAG: radical SAM-associated putative lipoprotein [Bacteroidales bacterium]|nr:radical SAM-associated putative lipoprotein [Bacteroidales bacterium]